MKPSNKQTSLRALRTFCVAARHGSFRIAAERLFVTPSAVSHQVKGLELELGITLFERGSRAIGLTEAGQALFDQVNPLILQIDRVTAQFKQHSSRHTLRVSVQPFFASELFVPRLAEFIEQHPEIDMVIDTTDEDPEKHPSAADVSIRVFRKAPTHLSAEAFFPLRIVPACTREWKRKILNGSSSPANPFPIIEHSRRNAWWQWWSDSAGIDVPKPSSTLHLDSTVAVVRAAEQGLGVAMVPVPASNRLFKQDQLVRLYEHEAATPERYYFVSSNEAASTPSVKALRNWVFDTFESLS